MIPVPALRLLTYAAREAWQLRRIEGEHAVPYLTRHVLWGVNALEDHDPGVPSSAFVHELHTADGDRHMHNHPWAWSASVVLTGGYVEHRRGTWQEISQCTYRAGDLVLFRTDDYHRIVSVEPNTVTLFLCGREAQDWGFLVDGVHVPHRDYFECRDSNHMETVRL